MKRAAVEADGVDLDRVHQRTVPAKGAAPFSKPGPSSVFDIAKAPKKPRAGLPPIDLGSVKVEKGVAIPELVRRTNPLHDLLARLLPDTSAKLPIAYSGALRTAIGSFAKKFPDRKFTVRSTQTDVRVWRTA